MNRLTKVVSIHNDEPEFYEANIDLYPKMMGYEYQQAEMDCINKLGQLEDIEEELGIDLITLFKALKGRIYSIHPKMRKICLIIFHVFYYCGNQWVIGCHSMEWNAEENSCDNWDCFLKDYGKTWALTREEIEENE